MGPLPINQKHFQRINTCYEHMYDQLNWNQTTVYKLQHKFQKCKLKCTQKIKERIK